MNGRGRRGTRSITSKVCYCSKCGYSQNHLAGQPCRNILCPNCGSVLKSIDSNQMFLAKQPDPALRSPEMYNRLLSEDNWQESGEVKLNHEAKVRYPFVDADKCTGCGTCVDVCRRQAIVLINGIPEIKSESCVNCRLCVRNCPVGALS